MRRHLGETPRQQLVRHRRAAVACDMGKCQDPAVAVGPVLRLAQLDHAVGDDRRQGRPRGFARPALALDSFPGLAGRRHQRHLDSGEADLASVRQLEAAAIDDRADLAVARGFAAAGGRDRRCRAFGAAARGAIRPVWSALAVFIDLIVLSIPAVLCAGARHGEHERHGEQKRRAPTPIQPPITRGAAPSTHRTPTSPKQMEPEKSGGTTADRLSLCAAAQRASRPLLLSCPRRTTWEDVMKTLAVSLLAAILAGPLAHAQDWPSRPVRLIAPFGVGGTADIVARLVADHLSVVFKQQFVVENRPGAGGAIGALAIARAERDGYTLGVTNVTTMSLVPVINPKTAYNPLTDFTHIAYIAGAPVVLAVHPSTNVKTLAEFVDYGRKAGKPLTFASAGVGSDGHVMGEAIAAALGVKVEHVPYRGTSQGLTDAVGGHIVFTTFTSASTASFLRAGTLQAVAVTSAQRLPDYPDVPTFNELGFPSLVSSTWYALAGPPGLPARDRREAERRARDLPGEARRWSSNCSATASCTSP